MGRVSLLQKIRAWFRPQAVDPEAEAERERLRVERETIRTSQLSPGGGGNMPPTPDVLDPKSGPK
jgi:hypothetical protein